MIINDNIFSQNKNLFKFNQIFPPALVGKEWQKLTGYWSTSSSTGNFFSPDSVSFCDMSVFCEIQTRYTSYGSSWKQGNLSIAALAPPEVCNHLPIQKTESQQSRKFKNIKLSVLAYIPGNILCLKGEEPNSMCNKKKYIAIAILPIVT